MSEIQDNMLTFSAFFEIHRETRGENCDTEPCNELGCQPDNKADGRNMLTGRQRMTTVKAILTLLKVNLIVVVYLCCLYLCLSWD